MATLTMIRRHGERGQAIIELALTLPLLLLIVIGIFDFGMMFQRYEMVTNAARELARVAVLPNYSPDQARQHAMNYLTAGGLNGAGAANELDCGAGVSAGHVCVNVHTAQESVSTSPAKTINIVVATVSYDHSHGMVGPIMSLFGGSIGTVRLKSVSRMRVE
jgi:Flp pilus assembly protein TadG